MGALDKVAYNRDAHYCRLLEDLLNAIRQYPATVYIEVRWGETLEAGPIRFEVLNLPSELPETRPTSCGRCGLDTLYSV